MALAIPGTAGDIPGRLDVAARSGTDTLDITIELEDCAQVGIPNDRDVGITLISETHGRAHVEGRVRGESVRFEARTVVEFNRAA